MRALGVLALLLFGTCCPSRGFAEDVRLALLVANESGWKEEPKLRYVLQGDLRPLKARLQSLGFRVLVLENRGPDALRRQFRKLKSLIEKTNVTTFLFYYTGHAGPRYFHLGARGSSPLGYKEFLKYLLALPVRRRFAVLDACFSGEVIKVFGSLKRYQKLFRGGMLAKGIRRRIKLDLKKHIPNQGHEARGLQLIGSSLSLSFESAKRKASAFTFHLLIGLKGKADLDQDGKISFDELFLFTRREVRKETGQEPQRLFLSASGEPYGFAPVYTSRLLLAPALKGKLRLSLKNFVWRHNKQKKGLLLAVPPGEGVVHLEREKTCLQQKIRFEKGKTTKLSASGWGVVSCQKEEDARKGLTSLEFTKAEPSALNMGMFFGFRSSGFTGAPFLGGAAFDLRTPYLGLRVGLWGASVPFGGSSQTQLVLQTWFDAGLRFRISLLSLFAGLYVGTSLFFQDVGSENKKFGVLLDAGAGIVTTYWFSREWGLTLDVNAGVLFGYMARFSLFASLGLTVGVRYRF